MSKKKVFAARNLKTAYQIYHSKEKKKKKKKRYFFFNRYNFVLSLKRVSFII